MQNQHNLPISHPDHPHHHHPPLSSLVHPHLHTILHLAAEHGLPEPRWTAFKPEEKRSISSDKTITPSSTIKTPKATLQLGGTYHDDIGPTPLSKQHTLLSEVQGSPPQLEPQPHHFNASLIPGWAEPHPVMLSPTAEKPQMEFTSEPQPRSSRELSPVSPQRRKDTIDPAMKRKEEQQQHIHRHATENEIWIEIADACRVVADGLKEGE